MRSHETVRVLLLAVVVLMLGMLGLAPTASAQSTTYSYTGGAYTVVSTNTTCTIGVCATYNTTQRISGSFTVAAPLPANQAAYTNVTPTAFSFSDGINTYASTDPNIRVSSFTAATDGVGQINDAYISVQRWTTGVNPHVVGNRLNTIDFGDAFIGELARNNYFCSTLAGGDQCSVVTGDTSSSSGSGTQGSWIIGALATPTVTSIAPSAGSTAGGTVVTITGTNLTGATGVTVGGVAGTSLTGNTATSLTFTTPAGAAATVNVLVTTGTGTSSAGAGSQFTYSAAPPPPVAVPTLSEWAMILFGLALASGAVLMIQRQRFTA